MNDMDEKLNAAVNAAMNACFLCGDIPLPDSDLTVRQCPFGFPVCAVCEQFSPRCNYTPEHKCSFTCLPIPYAILAAAATKHKGAKIFITYNSDETHKLQDQLRSGDIIIQDELPSIPSRPSMMEKLPFENLKQLAPSNSQSLSTRIAELNAASLKFPVLSTEIKLPVNTISILARVEQRKEKKKWNKKQRTLDNTQQNRKLLSKKGRRLQ